MTGSRVTGFGRSFWACFRAELGDLLRQPLAWLGAIATITKPFDIDTLLEAVADALAGDGSMDDVTP